jgi:LacI family transcriptional regulator
VDNNPAFCEGVSPTLTSIQLDHEGSGYLAAKMVGERFGDARKSATAGTLVNPLLVVRRESTGGAGRREPHVLAAVERIRREACDGLTPRDVIAGAPGSKSLFNLRFREAMGHSVHDEIEHVRFEKVFTLLAQTNTAIGAIPGLCGYSTNIALHKAFRQRTGMSMAEWRKLNR